MIYNIVVARYNEDIEWAYNIKEDINIIIYNKGDDININKQNIEIIKLGNIGRESHTYLYHIIKNYDNLADITLFTQANYKDHYSYDIFNYLNKINFFPFEKVEYNYRNYDTYPNKYNLNFKGWMIKYIDKDIENYYKDDNILKCKYGAIFTIKKENILTRSIEYYKNLIYQLYTKNPEEGHFFERSWYYIFNLHLLDYDLKLLKENIYFHKRIWLLWLQGWEDVPRLQYKIAKSWENNNSDYKIEYVSLENIKYYVNDIEYIFDENKNISNQAKSDIIRLSLLKNHGGVWADCTLLCMQPLEHWISDILKYTGFWMYHGNGGGMICDGPASWFIISSKNNYIINKWKDACDNYWNDNNMADNYFWMDGLFRDLIYRDNIFRDIWLKTPYLLCELEGQSHTLSNGNIYLNNHIKDILYNKPPYVLKLWNDFNSYMYYDTVNPDITKLVNGQYAIYLSDRKYIYKHNIKIGLVIARYNENIEWVNNINKFINIYVYNKNEEDIGIKLDNIGRESHTYLYHIINNYENLDDIIIFTQGNYKDHNIDNILGLLQNINIFNRYTFIQDDKFRKLDNNILRNKEDLNFNEWIDKYIEKDLSIYLREKNIMYCNFGAIFSIKKENILTRKKEYYINIFNTLDNINPEEGHYIERMWYYIFKLHK